MLALANFLALFYRFLEKMQANLLAVANFLLFFLLKRIKLTIILKEVG